jgi:hypothetical protein
MATLSNLIHMFPSGGGAGILPSPACLREPRRAGARLMVMTASRRLTLALAAMAAPAALAAGCANAPSSAHPATAVSERAAATASFSAMGLAFRYPATWQSGTWSTDESSFSQLIVFLSTSRLKNPCAVSTSPHEIAQTCVYPIGALPPGGVLVRWSANGHPPWLPTHPNTTIAGRKALETRTSGGWCATLLGTETITVQIPRAVPGNWYQMDACLRGPGLPQQEAQITSMLRSVQIAAGS